jgi:hypothetical protein
VPRLNGHGRDEDCSPPPVQIRACGFPAPGSCLRSNAIGLRGIGYPYSSDPWARCFSDMLIPALCPGHEPRRALPSTGRLPSTVSAADVTRHCSRLHRYYAAVRLLTRVHAHRSAVAFMGRSGWHRTRMRSPRFRRKDVSTCMGSPTARGSSSASHLRGEDVAFRPRERRQHLGIRPVSQLNTQPVVSLVNASSWPSRAALASLRAGAAG